MSTRIIEVMGTVAALEARSNLTRLTIEAPAITEGVGVGGSVAVSGVPAIA
jgi:riboflavin synthase